MNSSGLSFDIRPCTGADLAAVEALQEEVLAGLPSPELLLRNSHAVLARSLCPPNLMLGAFCGETLAAVSTLYHPTDPADDYSRRLTTVSAAGLRTANYKLCIVREAFRGHGLQCRLAAALEQAAEKQGVALLYVTVSPKNPHSYRNIEKSGYTRDRLLVRGGYERYLYYKRICTEKGVFCMSEVLKTIRERRSTKQFKSDPVPEEILGQILEAGTYAATGRGIQSPLIVAVTNPAERDRLSRMNAKFLGAPDGYDPFYGAPVVVVVLADRTVPTHVYDGSLVMGNLMLAAEALGVGSCWIHRAREEFDSPEGKAFLAEHGITGDYEGIGHCVIGYPAGERRPAAPRKAEYIRLVR